MYCQEHKVNNCIECAISEQTKQIVDAINENGTVTNHMPIDLWPLAWAIGFVCLTLYGIF